MAWYDHDHRDLPWRRDPSAYKTLVSELMLQQTVVATVIPYFERFMARFPDFLALASAQEDQVLALWSGLGYYSRARNLHHLAKAVMARADRQLPRTEEGLMALPGVGPYTAAAVAAIAFGQRTFALDGNAVRVIARVFAVADPIDRPAVRKTLRALGTGLVPLRRSGDFAQAVMELGARICVPRNPRCADCPWSASCQGRAQGVAAALPRKSPRKSKRIVTLLGLGVERGDHILLVRRPAGALLGGTWTFPVHDLGGGPTATAVLLKDLGLRVRGPSRWIGEIRHIFTHLDVTVQVHSVVTSGILRKNADLRWVTRGDLADMGVSSFTTKLLATLAQGPAPA